MSEPVRQTKIRKAAANLSFIGALAAGLYAAWSDDNQVAWLITGAILLLYSIAQSLAAAGQDAGRYDDLVDALGDLSEEMNVEHPEVSRRIDDILLEYWGKK